VLSASLGMAESADTLEATKLEAATLELPTSERAPERVVLLHGLARDAGSMDSLAETLTAAGYAVFNFDYSSREKQPEELIAELRERVDKCCAASTAPLHFVTHSLGGILVRAYLAETPPPNLGRVVLLAPPNQGSEIIDTIGDSSAFLAFFGPTGAALGTGPDSLPNRIGVPDYPVGVIAGQQSVNPFGSALLPGPDDGAVSVERAKLDGAADFIVIDATHTFIMQNEIAKQQVLEFLRNGRFDHSLE
jgi:triacylglycerol lipase